MAATFHLYDAFLLSRCSTTGGAATAYPSVRNVGHGSDEYKIDAGI
jgi:hypothetical protein